MTALLDIRVEASGKWSSVLTLLGIDSRYFTGKHQDCPICQSGKDRFRWNRSTEYGHCNQCGTLSAIDMAINWTGKPYREAVKEIRQVLGVARVDAQNYKNDDLEKNKARLQKIHAGLKRIDGNCHASKYIAKRGLSVLPEKDAYYSESIAYFEEGKKLGDYPALVSVFRDVYGKTSSYHITYLSLAGDKAPVKSSKKILPPVLPLTGCAIQLFKPGKVLAIAEGIETALAVYELEGIPVWASGNAQQMETIKIPESVMEVWIYADSDASFTGQKSAYTLARRLVNEGKKVRVCSLIDQAWITDAGDRYDFLDYLIIKNKSESKHQNLQIG